MPSEVADQSGGSPARLSRSCGPAAAFFAGLTLVAAAASAQVSGEEGPSPNAVRLLWPPGQIAAGKTEVEVLPVSPEIRRVVFLLDGEEVETRSKPPWRVKIRFDDPPRLQNLTVKAIGAGNRVLGEDSAEINRVRRPFRVFLEPPGGRSVTGRVTLPRGAELEKVEIEVDGQSAGLARDAEFAVALAAELEPRQVVRALATLVDGRQIEDATVVGLERDITSTDVRLVQIQTLVTDRNRRPLTDLEAADFAVLEDGKPRQIDRVQKADDISLVLGLVVDTSGSMGPIWPSVERASNAFLNTVVTDVDEAFLVDFSTQVRLLHEPTSSRADIAAALAGVSPDGITALYDSIVFSMLQFGDRPGRRALVVITDGVDYGSQADPEKAVEIGRKLGIPVYVVFLPNNRGRGGRQAFSQGGLAQEMKLLTEPTGGRLIRVGGGRGAGGDGLLRAFRQIADELRSQYIISYYTDRPLADLDGRDVEVKVPERRKVEVRSVLAWDQIQ